MFYSDFLSFENPEVVAIALGVLVFIAMFDILRRSTGMERGSTALASLAVGLIVAGYLYIHPDQLQAPIFLVLFGLIILGVLYNFIRTFFRRR